MQNPHDLIWKFWASEQMAEDIAMRECWGNVSDSYQVIARILKKEWFR